MKKLIFITIISCALLSGCGQTETISSNLSDGYIVIDIKDNVLKIPKAKYSKVEDQYEWAKNFFRINSTTEINKFGQMITVFTLPMTEEDIGVPSDTEKLSENEYLESFCVHNDGITYQYRVDKGDYWVLSRETLHVPNQFMDREDMIDIDKENCKKIKTLYWADHQPIINNTRLMISDDF
jgi:hypothetical protein